LVARQRCVKFQVVSIAPGQNVTEAIRMQTIPIEKPANRSECESERDDSPDAQNSIAKGKGMAADDRTKPLLVSITPRVNAAEAIIMQMVTPVNEKDNLPFAQSPETKGNKIIHNQPLPPKSPIESPSSPAPEQRLVSPTTLSAYREQFEQKFSLEKLVISFSVSGGKVSKLSVIGSNGQVVMDVNLKKWEEKS
jgi:hypothetical protein